MQCEALVLPTRHAVPAVGGWGAGSLPREQYHGGAGIDRVEVSIDLGASWQGAKLGRDLGRFSFREFTLAVPARERGSIVVMARATSRSGETQVERLIHNPAGYHHNVIQRLYVEVV